MSTSVSDADYVCTLSEKSLKKAKEELNEDPKNRLGAVETFRQWILQQPHIKCPTETWFLLPFLRVRYFSQLEARKLLENFLSKRSKFPKWFRNLDSADTKTQAVLDTGFILMLPEKDDDGRQLIMLRLGALDSCIKNIFDETKRAIACVIDYIYFLDEDATVNGTVSFGDVGGYTLKLFTAENGNDRRDFLLTWQSSYPARIKQMHIYNVGPIMELIMTIIQSCVPEKLQQRVKIHGQLMENVYKDIPMRCLPTEYLPDDYDGPNAGTLQQVIEYTKKMLAQPKVRSRILYMSREEFGVDDKLKPSTDDGPVGSFRKLNID